MSVYDNAFEREKRESRRVSRFVSNLPSSSVFFFNFFFALDVKKSVWFENRHFDV